MTDLKSMTLEEISATLRAMGEPSFRGKQVFTWLHRGITDFDEMMNIPKSLREKLRAEYYITVPTVARKQVSKLDGTIKYLWELSDGNCIETVLMSYHHGNTVCISSQVGCRMGCKFCASGLNGKKRNLSAGEILDEILRTLIRKNVGIELNTGGYHYGLGEPNPCVNIIRRYRELGGEIITIGADAHKPEHIAYDFAKAEEILKSCGFKYYTEFFEQKPVFKQLI